MDPQVTVTSRSGSTATPYSRVNLAAMASRRERAPQVIAYWLMSPEIARRAASFTSSGAGKSGKPCERLIAPCRFASRVISRMTDSVKRAALADARMLMASQGPRGKPAAAGVGDGAAPTRYVMSGDSGRVRSTWPARVGTWRSSTRIWTRFTAGKLAVSELTTEYTLSSSPRDPPGCFSDASFERSTYAVPAAVTKVSMTFVSAGRVPTRPFCGPFTSSSTTVRTCRARSAE